MFVPPSKTHQINPLQSELVYCLAVVKSAKLNIIGRNFMTDYPATNSSKKSNYNSQHSSASQSSPLHFTADLLWISNFLLFSFVYMLYDHSFVWVIDSLCFRSIRCYSRVKIKKQRSIEDEDKYERYYEEAHNYEVVFCTPKLTSLTTAGHPTFKAPSAHDVPCLEKVKIDYCYHVAPHEYEFMCSFLQLLVNVKNLALCFEAFRCIEQTLRAMARKGTQPPCFVRLKSLTVDFTTNDREKVSNKKVREMANLLRGVTSGTLDKGGGSDELFWSLYPTYLCIQVANTRIIHRFEVKREVTDGQATGRTARAGRGGHSLSLVT
ncbi:hypothetical protein P8452_21882 [Trifolium repens]|nr:hypothetical protein P8452_21882 [Trifolium repens]